MAHSFIHSSPAGTRPHLRGRALDVRHADNRCVATRTAVARTRRPTLFSRNKVASPPHHRITGPGGIVPGRRLSAHILSRPVVPAEGEKRHLRSGAAPVLAAHPEDCQRVCVSRNEPRVPLVPPFLVAVSGSEGPRLPLYRGVFGFYQLIRRLRLRRRRPNALKHASSPLAAFGAAGGAPLQLR